MQQNDTTDQIKADVAANPDSTAPIIGESGWRYEPDRVDDHPPDHIDVDPPPEGGGEGH
jgi:hypothetical protein